MDELRQLTAQMAREGIRRLAAEELGLPTSSYRFAGDKAAFLQAVEEIGYPCIVKPVMSSSGKGQSFIRDSSTLDNAWDYAQQGGRKPQQMDDDLGPAFPSEASNMDDVPF